MKKTNKTALTAAAFATALNVIPMGTEAYDPSEDPIQDVYGPPVYFETTTYDNKPQPDYGPPETTSVTTITTSVTEEPVISETKYNSAPVYGPPPILGDIYDDGIVDSFDLVYMRQMFLKYFNDGNNNYAFNYDLNRDRSVSIADLVILNKFILGENVKLGYQYSDEPTVTTTTETQFSSVYGPPAWFDNEEVTTTSQDELILNTESSFVTVYGPPSSIHINTVTTAVSNDISTNDVFDDTEHSTSQEDN